jgi:hypothetical protein
MAGSTNILASYQIPAASTATTFLNSTGAGGHGTNCSISTVTATNDKATLISSQSIAQLGITKTSGKWYMEYKLSMSSNATTYYAVGCSNVDDVGNGQYGAHSYEYAWGQDGGTRVLYVAAAPTYGYGTLPANGDIIMVAIDITNLKIYYGLNGTWFNSGNPATGTNPASSISGSTFWFGVGMGIYSGGSNGFQIMVTPTYTIPTGFSQP